MVPTLKKKTLFQSQELLCVLSEKVSDQKLDVDNLVFANISLKVVDLTNGTVASYHEEADNPIGKCFQCRPCV